MATPAAPIGGAVDHAELVGRLGHPVYAERRDARRRLLDAGLSAFDALRRGREDPDPEVAAASGALLDELTLDWSRVGDPADVRALLREYEGLLPGGRVDRVEELATLPDQRGVPAVARIARFEPSDAVARRAAALLLATNAFGLDGRRLAAMRQAVEELAQQYGPAKRDAGAWLRLAADESEVGAERASDAWRGHAERQLLELRSARGETSLAVVATVHWRWLRAALAADQRAESLVAVETMLDLEADRRQQRLIRSLRWAAEAGRFGIADRLVTAHDALLQDKRGLYARADLAAMSGDTEAADRLAAEALDAASEATSNSETLLGPRVLVAGDLRKRGHDAWAVAELSAAAAPLEPLDGSAAVARWRLGRAHFDAERYTEAAEAMRPLIDLLDGSKATLQQYGALPQVRRDYLPDHRPRNASSRSALVAFERLATALAARKAGDREGEVAALREAIAADGADADIVIAMHRVVDPPGDFARLCRSQAAQLRRLFENAIWSNADDPDPFESANPFNQWAWLVANTEGDFEKAVRYSRRSLELAPDTAGYLDTLGRCLFSAGRVEEAIAVQRRAVELEPGMLVMQRQLAEFESAVDDPRSEIE